MEHIVVIDGSVEGKGGFVGLANVVNINRIWVSRHIIIHRLHKHVRMHVDAVVRLGRTRRGLADGLLLPYLWFRSVLQVLLIDHGKKGRTISFLVVGAAFIGALVTLRGRGSRLVLVGGISFLTRDFVTKVALTSDEKFMRISWSWERSNTKREKKSPCIHRLSPNFPTKELRKLFMTYHLRLGWDDVCAGRFRTDSIVF